MTDQQQHPMIPPNILLNNWESDWFAERENVDVLLIQAYQAGADAELEACCELLKQKGVPAWSLLRTARRPKPQSLKEQACAALDAYIYGNPDHNDKQNTYNTIRRALEALSDD